MPVKLILTPCAAAGFPWFIDPERGSHWIIEDLRNAIRDRLLKLSQ